MTGATVAVAALSGFSAGAGMAAPPGSPAGAAVAGPASARSVAPAIRPPHGLPFHPTLGDWEGSIGGYSASFELAIARGRRHTGYGIRNLVVTEPQTCPARGSRYREALLTPGTPLRLAAFGSLGLARFGFGGGLSGSGSATLTRAYRIGPCHGTLRWRMRPATRREVQDGPWRARFPGGATASFRVRGGGRLAIGITLPAALRACNGIVGGIDLFIGADGTASLSSADLRATMRFAGARATGTLNAPGRGCRHGPLRFTAAAGR